MFYGLVILPVTVLMWFSFKTVGGNEKSYSFPPLQHSDMIHMGLYTGSRKKEKYKKLSWHIYISGDSRCKSGMLLEKATIVSSALHLKLKMTGSNSPMGSVWNKSMSNRPLNIHRVQILIIEMFKNWDKPCVLFKSFIGSMAIEPNQSSTVPAVFANTRLINNSRLIKCKETVLTGLEWIQMYFHRNPAETRASCGLSQDT